MMRRRAVHSLDVDDYHPEEQYLDLRHRPDPGAPIKNGYDRKRYVALSSELCLLLDDWVRDCRPGVSDENGREAARAAKGHEFVTNLPDGCDTMWASAA